MSSLSERHQGQEGIQLERFARPATPRTLLARHRIAAEGLADA